MCKTLKEADNKDVLVIFRSIYDMLNIVHEGKIKKKSSNITPNPPRAVRCETKTTYYVVDLISATVEKW